MEKTIHIVEISNIHGNNQEIKKKNFLFKHILDNILLIQDIFFSIYFVYNKESNLIHIYLINNLSFQKTESSINDDNLNYFSLSKKDFKFFLLNMNLDFQKNNLIEKIHFHFLNYDHNLWNDINDWLNNNLNYIHFKYHLLFIKINSLIPFSKK